MGVTTISGNWKPFWIFCWNYIWRFQLVEICFGLIYLSGAAQVLDRFVLFNLWFSVWCFVDRCLSFFFWPLCCLSFVYIRVLIAPLVSLISSCLSWFWLSCLGCLVYLFSETLTLFGFPRTCYPHARHFDYVLFYIIVLFIQWVVPYFYLHDMYLFNLLLSRLLLKWLPLCINTTINQPEIIVHTIQRQRSKVDLETHKMGGRKLPPNIS